MASSVHGATVSSGSGVLQGVSEKTEQILICSQLRIADRGMNYLINIDYLGTYKVE